MALRDKVREASIWTLDNYTFTSAALYIIKRELITDIVISSTHYKGNYKFLKCKPSYINGAIGKPLYWALSDVEDYRTKYVTCCLTGKFSISVATHGHISRASDRNQPPAEISPHSTRLRGVRLRASLYTRVTFGWHGYIWAASQNNYYHNY